jgi:diguanylate cyclase (GGDEF)-like protein/putative nucleotidyltransferase with HDIG domain
VNVPHVPITRLRAVTAMQTTAGRAEAVTLSRLNSLLQVAGVVRSREDLQPLLEGVAATAAEALGFGAVVVNLRRPAWNDMEVAVVVDRHGRGMSELLGELVPFEELARLLDPRFDRGGVFLIPHDRFDFGSLSIAFEVGRVQGEGPDGWHPEDMLIAPLRDSGGSLLGFLSCDDPIDGRRPGPDGLEALAAVAAITASIIENAQVAAEGARRRAAVEHLLRVSSELAVPRSRADMLQAVCDGVREALGFEKVAVYLWEPGDDVFQPVAAVGPRTVADLPPMHGGAMLEATAPERRHEGCVLLEREQGLGLIPDPGDRYPSERNGRGPRAWNHHWLVVPLVDATGKTVGALWADDPADRLLPTDDDLRALRTFANHAVTAIASARALDTMRHLAEHDPLTGLRNRRTFEPGLAAALARTPVSLLIADLDRFKHVNDILGHSEGDAVLRRFADVLRRFGRSGDLPVRLGGEEFALVLPAPDEHAAVSVAERLRAATAAEFSGFEVPVTVSIGIACGAPGGSAGTLVRDANRALFAAKRLGRDRVVVHNAETLAVLGALADERGGEQIAAALLLAETLDLRDVATARHSLTVGAYAERTARALSLPADRVERIRVAGLLHDIGKLGVSDAILQKPDPLTELEWAEIRRHPELGARILDHANLRDVSGWVRGHHERMDGGGYPDGLSGQEIALESRILAVADAYEAMTAHRPYRRALDAATARAELERHSGTQFDAAVVAAFLRALED